MRWLQSSAVKNSLRWFRMPEFNFGSSMWFRQDKVTQ